MVAESQTVLDARARVEAMRVELKALEASVPRAPRALTFKVSAKGALSIYGLGKWPVTLYKSQFDQFEEAIPAMRAFVDAHAAEFSVKA